MQIFAMNRNTSRFTNGQLFLTHIEMYEPISDLKVARVTNQNLI